MVVPVGLSYRSPTTSIHALCIQQEAFTTSHPLLVSGKGKEALPNSLLGIEILH